MNSPVAAGAPGGATGLRGRPFRLLMAATVASFTGYVLMLPLVPLWAVRHGASEAGAGAATAVFMGATVAVQLFMPWLLGRAGGYRWAFPVGALLIALPTPLLLLSGGLGPVLAVSAVRGAGFGLFSVAGAALSARLVEPREIGRAAGYYGLAVGLPHVVFLSTGVGVALQLGFAPAFWTATLLPLLGAAASAFIGPGRGAGGGGAAAAAPAPSRREQAAAMAVPLALMLAAAAAASGFLTFLSIPLERMPWAAAAALLGYGAGSVALRWAAGVVSDRTGRPALLVPGTAASAAGAALAAWALWSPVPDGAAGWLAVAGATLFGAGFGAAQNDTITVMFRRGGPGAYGTASAAWNIGFDGGTGIGAVALGWAIGAAGYGPAFLGAAAVVLASVPAAALTARTRT
ncbi:MFS transporter [Nocardiopsis sp. RSe5-2]|uniref:MFS transporter n=1 Tax=Nocardiopsis endophytica TaxID=3018445 RepID=A0ABT4U1K5_9ACTN|nr:MFS transporter [Nocardiopsis endophytica]MDA2810835.1 MFS transporter [Nocardiopsis endophytica]